MRRGSFLSALAFIALLGSIPYEVLAGEGDDAYRVLPVGGEELIDLDFVPDITEMQSEILEVKAGPTDHQIRLIALTPGKGAFIVNNKTGEVVKKIKYHVIRMEKFQRFANVKRLLKSLKGISVTFEGENIVVDGTTSRQGLDRILRLREAYPEILNLADTSSP
ncbi:MAG: hypothetical protein ACXVB9_10600 [Bdellovibrionota bacterium]